MLRNHKGYSVRLDHISFKPPRFLSKPVLNDVSLTIEPGQIVAVIGENGSGKSSILAAIAGELDYWDGDVMIENAHITAQARKLIDGVGIVHQDENADLVPHLSLAANIYIRKLQREFNAKVMRFLDGNEELEKQVRTGLAEHAKWLHEPMETLVGRLSGGERQMLNAAIAIHFENECNPCRLLLLDEHTSKLSSKNSRKVLSYVLEETNKVSCTVVMVTHRLEDVTAFCDRAIIMGEGKIMRDLTRRELVKLNTADLEAMF